MATHPPYLEIACFSSSSALLATEQGANRVELCAGPPSSGGLTPPVEDLTRLLSSLSALERSRPAVHVMIRPRPDDFTCFYTDDEIGAMVESITDLKRAGADGFVFGVLGRSVSGVVQVDVPRTRVLVEAAVPLRCTFHRAFDVCGIHDPGQKNNMSLKKALSDVAGTGCLAVLTSGGPGDVSASGNFESLRDLIAYGREDLGEAVEIVIGGGIRGSNLSNIMDNVGDGASWYHSSARTKQSGDSVDVQELESIVATLGNKKPSEP